ncbi:MAG: hypothetical protein SVZ03_14785 [Spirochaetota bacterium]|nr:hypothetical protein [Spirochaetota bacterium]
MKRVLCWTLVLIGVAAFISCGGPKRGGMVKGDEFISEGWVSADIFRVTATGVPKEGLTNKIQRRGTSKEAALIMGQKRVLEKFVGARLEGAAGAADYASTGIAIAKEFGGIVKGGTIVKETYDEEDNCEIIYQIEKKGLRASVQGGATAVE